MRASTNFTKIICTSALIGAISILPACSGTTPVAPSVASHVASLPPTTSSSLNGARSDVRSDRELKGVYVADINANDIAIFSNGHYKSRGIISNGINEPVGEWIDKKGNLYVANVGSAQVEEYGPGDKSPKATYSEGLYEPIREAVDAKGNVYVADYNVGSNFSYINEYAQGVNSVKQEFVTNGNAEDVAIDGSGDLFVDVVDTRTGAGGIEEFPAGSTKGQMLGVSFGWPAAMAMDKQGDLLVCDTTADVVDVIPAPYSSVAGTVGKFTHPYNLALNASANRLYVVDIAPGSATAVVDIVSYPSGKLLKRLGTENGLSFPYGVAVAPELQ
jgi:hypothetical protein